MPLSGIGCYGVSGGAVFYAFALSAWVLLLYLLKGTGPFNRDGVTLLSLLLLYGVTGPMAGLVVGACLPIARWQLGAVVVGILAAVPVGIGAALAVVEERPWAGAHTFVASMISLFGGGMGGVVFRAAFYQGARPPG